MIKNSHKLFTGQKINFLNLKWLKIYTFEKVIGRKSEDKNINKIEKY